MAEVDAPEHSGPPSTCDVCAADCSAIRATVHQLDSTQAQDTRHSQRSSPRDRHLVWDTLMSLALEWWIIPQTRRHRPGPSITVSHTSPLAT